MTIHRQIREQLAQLYIEDETFGFLYTSQRLLDWEIPAQLIAAGRGEEVLRAIKATNEGNHL